MAYAIGLITTDGCLFGDGRHLYFTSKDEDLVEIFKKCLNLSNKIGRKARGGEKIKKYFRIQFGSKKLYQDLVKLGLSSAKSKKIGTLRIPKEYFTDFLRGCIDGDGSISVVAHPESQHPQLRVRLHSGSKLFLEWIKIQIEKMYGVEGGWIDVGKNIFTLAYGKQDSIRILNRIYYVGVESYLNRKYLIALPFLRM